MSQAAGFGSGGGGGGTVSSLTPDVGAAVPGVAGTIPTLGYQAGTVQTMRTYNDGAGNFRIEDQTWHTQYVVDASTTNGLRGTFTTIQAAINQAVSDGATYTAQRVIYIRVGTYAENLTLPGGIILVGETLSAPFGGAILPLGNTAIVGNHTFTGNAVCGFNNLIFEQTVSGDIFNGGSAAVVLGFMDNCLVVNTGSGQMVNAMPSGSSFNLIGCSFRGAGTATQFTGTNMTSLIFEDCTFGPGVCDINADTCSTTFMRNCTGASATTGIGTVTTAQSLVAIDCWFYSGGAYCITGTGFGQLKGCHFGAASTAAINNASNNWSLNGCSTSVIADIPLFTTAANATVREEIQGNIICSTLTATNLNVTTSMYYVGVTSTASARTINLPDGTGTGGILPTPGQVFIVKDQSGAAGTNNITVTTVSGTPTIDGAATAVINTNYGSLSFKFDGTNYFIL